MHIRPKISEVFTPRRTDVNQSIYIERENLEGEIKNALKGSLHIFLRGNSGNGKSWLYRKVLAELDVHCVEANCANAARLKSLTREIYESSVPSGKSTIEGYDETKSAGLSAGLANGHLKHTNRYALKEDEKLLVAFSQMRSEAGSKLTVLILDNLEAIFSSQEIMDELGNILMLLDDPRYSKKNVKILLVGTPRSIVEYYSKLDNFLTIGNRVQELSEVSPLTKNQVYKLTRKGLIERLRIEVDNDTFRDWQDHIYNVTLGIPQRVHEYCEQLAYILEDNGWRDTFVQLEEADRSWLKLGLRESCYIVEGLMNNHTAKTGRKDQVLYALGKIGVTSFTSKDIENWIRNNFIDSTKGVTLPISKVLSDFTKGDRAILQRTRNSSVYTFTDSRYIMALRVMLNKREGDERVVKLAI